MGSLIIIIEVGRIISGDFFIEFVEEKFMENIEEFTCGFKLWGLDGFAFVKGDGDGVDFEFERIAWVIPRGKAAPGDDFVVDVCDPIKAHHVEEEVHWKFLLASSVILSRVRRRS